MPPDEALAAEPDVAALCERWRQASLDAGWTFPSDWWAPAVEALAEAVCNQHDATAACVELGRARAHAAIGLDEALRDLAALAGLDGILASLPPPGTRPPTRELSSAPTAELSPAAGIGPHQSALGGRVSLEGLEAGLERTELGTLDRIGVGWTGLDCAEVPGPMLAALALGWADVSCDPTAGGGCEDPLTGLVTSAYLRVRLGEVYREEQRRGLPVPSQYAFVVAEVDMYGAGKLAQVSRSMLLAHCLRSTFSGGETLCGAGPSRALALVRRDAGVSAFAGTLRRLLAAELDPFTDSPARVWIEQLPGTLEAAHQLLAELAR
jgi:hypothetical protein